LLGLYNIIISLAISKISYFNSNFLISLKLNQWSRAHLFPSPIPSKAHQSFGWDWWDWVLGLEKGSIKAQSFGQIGRKNCKLESEIKALAKKLWKI